MTPVSLPPSSDLGGVAPAYILYGKGSKPSIHMTQFKRLSWRITLKWKITAVVVKRTFRFLWKSLAAFGLVREARNNETLETMNPYESALESFSNERRRSFGRGQISSIYPISGADDITKGSAFLYRFRYIKIYIICFVSLILRSLVFFIFFGGVVNMKHASVCKFVKRKKEYLPTSICMCDRVKMCEQGPHLYAHKTQVALNKWSKPLKHYTPSRSREDSNYMHTNTTVISASSSLCSGYKDQWLKKETKTRVIKSSCDLSKKSEEGERRH